MNSRHATYHETSAENIDFGPDVVIWAMFWKSTSWKVELWTKEFSVLTLSQPKSEPGEKSLRAFGLGSWILIYLSS
jgi:hypothetical protein